MDFSSGVFVHVLDEYFTRYNSILVHNSTACVCIYSYQRWGQSTHNNSRDCASYMVNQKAVFQQGLQSGAAVSIHTSR
jgi:hypothetical protein